MRTSSLATSSDGKGGEIGLSNTGREAPGLVVFDGVLVRSGEAVSSLMDDEEPGACEESQRGYEKRLTIG